MKIKSKNKKNTIEEDVTVKEVILSDEASAIQHSDLDKKISNTVAAKEDSKESKISKRSKGTVQNNAPKNKTKVMHIDEAEIIHRKVKKPKKDNSNVDEDIEKYCYDSDHNEELEENKTVFANDETEVVQVKVKNSKKKISNIDVDNKDEDTEKQCNESDHNKELEEKKSDKVASEDCKTMSKKRKKRRKQGATDEHKKNSTNAESEEVEPIKAKNPKKNIFNVEEAEVKDEDIDKFCDELDEKDNEQYENWVKLIESNFRVNKKKT